MTGDIPITRFIEPRVEVELAFILGRALSGPDCTIEDVYGRHRMGRAGDRDHRRADSPDRSGDRNDTESVRYHLRQCRQCRHCVWAAKRIRPDAVDLQWVAALLRRNDVIEESGVAAAVLGHPALGVAWLANKLAPWGETLKPGEIILSGSFTAPVFASAGDRFHVDYHGARQHLREVRMNRLKSALAEGQAAIRPVAVARPSLYGGDLRRCRV